MRIHNEPRDEISLRTLMGIYITYRDVYDMYIKSVDKKTERNRFQPYIHIGGCDGPNRTDQCFYSCGVKLLWQTFIRMEPPMPSFAGRQGGSGSTRPHWEHEGSLKFPLRFMVHPSILGGFLIHRGSPSHAF